MTMYAKEDGSALPLPTHVKAEISLSPQTGKVGVKAESDELGTTAAMDTAVDVALHGYRRLVRESVAA